MDKSLSTDTMVLSILDDHPTPSIMVCMKNHKSSMYYARVDGVTGRTLDVYNLEFSQPTLGEIVEGSDHRIYFTAKNATGHGTISGTDEYGNDFSKTVRVYGEFDFSFNVENAGDFQAKLYDIDIDSGLKTLIASKWFSNNSVTFPNVLVDKWELKIISTSPQIHIYSNYINTQINSFYTEEFNDWYCSVDLFFSGQSATLLKSMNSLVLGEFETVVSAMKKGFTFPHYYIPVPVKVYCKDNIQTAYTSIFGLMQINKASSAKDHLDEDVLLHEFGHYVMDVLTNNMLPYSSSHSWYSSSDIPTAYKEGWATFFGCYITNDPIYVDINYNGSPSMTANIETINFSLPNSPNGNIWEAAVAASLWDIFDSNIEYYDAINLGASEIVTTLAGTSTNSIDVFVDKWKTNNFPNVYYQFISHGISYSDLPSQPSVPTGFTVSGFSGQHPILSWNLNPESNIYQYKIYKDGNLLTSVSSSTNNYTVSSMIVGDKFADVTCFTIEAVSTSLGYSGQTSPKCTREDGGSSAEKVSLNSLNKPNTPKEYKLFNSFPNPFNPSTQITYQLPKDGFVNLVVYNSLGQNIAELVNEHQTIGKYSVLFNASNLPSGVYIYKLQAGGFSAVSKMILAK